MARPSKDRNFDRHRREAEIENYHFLVETGLSPEVAAKRVGISLEVIEKRAERAGKTA